MDSVGYSGVSREIYKAIINDDWNSVSHIFIADRERLNSSISSYGGTPLYIAVGTNSSHHFVEKLVEQIMNVGGGVEMLRTTFTDSNQNALHQAARKGNIRAMKLLVRNYPHMPQIVDGNMDVPLQLAAWLGDEETVRFLLSVTRDEILVGENGTITSLFQGIRGASILGDIIAAGLFDVALDLVQKHSHLVAETNDSIEETALGVLAAQKNAFRSGSRLGYVERIIYSRIRVNRNQMFDYIPVLGQHQINADMEGGMRSRPTNNLNVLQRCFEKIPYIKHIRGIKVRHLQAEQLLKQILLVLLNLEDDINMRIIGNAIQTAVAHGNYELIQECVRSHPEIIWYKEKKGSGKEKKGAGKEEEESGEEEAEPSEKGSSEETREEEAELSKEGPIEKGSSEETREEDGPSKEGHDLFEAAIIHRQEKVFSLMYQVSAYKSGLLDSVDGENALHLVGKLAPYDRLTAVTGVALQMQRELLWFKEVENLIDPAQRRLLNHDNKTPRMVFTDEHKQLLIDAQQWTKDTSSSSTVVAALLITITFAAMFTVPGGINDYGKSIFLRDPVFLLFIISDAIALFSSSTSVLMFLSILTHSTQEDFLYALPLRLTLGFISLFISLATTMIAFSATLVLVLRDEIKWIAAPVTLLASVPAILFLWLQYPLLQELVGATFGKSIFRKRSNVLLH